MDTNQLNEWLQTAASVGVILSLIFVGLEIQQAREIALADVHQQRAAMAIQIEQNYVPVNEYFDARNKLRTGERLSQSELAVLRAAQLAWFQYWENNFFQYQLGLLDEESWQSSRRIILSRFDELIYRDWWRSTRHGWREEFAQEIDEILTEAEARQKVQ